MGFTTVQFLFKRATHFFLFLKIIPLLIIAPPVNFSLLYFVNYILHFITYKSSLKLLCLQTSFIHSLFSLELILQHRQIRSPNDFF